MESWISGLALHGYSVLFAAVFLEAVGLPIPAALALLIAGGASARGSLQGSYALGGAFLAMIAGDTLMFAMGRYTGWWLLGVLCRISLNPESCILRSADSFYRRGRALLVVAKFIPGINTMAPPLAGCMNMSLTQFLGLDLVMWPFRFGCGSEHRRYVPFRSRSLPRRRGKGRLVLASTTCAATATSMPRLLVSRDPEDWIPTR